MGKVRPWQIGLFIVAGAALAVGLYFTFGRGQSVRTADSIMLVDVVTGDRFTFSVAGRRAVVIPETHPESGERTLFPFEERDGRHFLSPRVRGDITPEFIEEIASKGSIALDPSTHEVRVSERSPRRARRKE